MQSFAATMSRIYLLTITSPILLLQITLSHALSSHITLSNPRTKIKAQIGEVLHITCKATKCDEPKFTWASLMDNTLSGTFNTAGKNSTLTMKVSTESDGSYRCAVSCNKPPGEKSFKIVVYSFPSDPILHISSSVVGEQSRITCTLLNVYRAEMMTAHILLDSEKVASYVGAEMGGSEQEIKNITLSHDLTLQEKNDGKNIECVAFLELEDDGSLSIMKHTSMDLNLMYPPIKPQITHHPSTTVRAGDKVTLTCSSESRSHVTIQWVKLYYGKELEMSSDAQGSLILPSAEPEDSGVYICYAKNNVGSTSSHVEITVQGLPGNPRITIHPEATVIAGESVLIKCFASGNPNTNVTLWKASEEEDILLLDTEGEFFIKEADPIDTAVYICKAENLYGIAVTSESLTVKYPPKNTYVYIKPSSVKEEEKVNISCTSEGPPTPRLILKMKTEHRQVEWEPESGQYNISHAGAENSGTFLCESSTGVGQQIAEATLTVQVPPRNTILTVTPSPVVREGDNVHIKCSSEAFPPPRLVLMFRTEHSLIYLESENGEYNISHAGMEHTGTYICESSNVVYQQTAEITLTVKVPPKNTLITIVPSLEVSEGDYAQIICTSQASPAPTLVLKWKTEHDLIELESENGQYNISHTELGHTGTYICESRNMVGQQVAEISMTVNVAPKNTNLTIMPSPMVKEGDSVQILCTSEASPTPTLVLKLRTEHGLMELESENGQYNITYAGMEHAGTYLCESDNILGQEVTESPLVVQIPHRNTTVVVTPSQNITEGDTVTITCETHSIPSPTMILQKVCARNSTVLHTSNGTFTLHNVTLNDTGTYTLNIISSDGNETEVINIIVAERQQSPRFNYIYTLIIGSLAFVSAGIMIGVIVYRLKQSKVKGSYSLVKALRSKV